MKNELLMKWWFWVCVVFIVLIGSIFIISMTYALHPTEIRFYANDEMVATAQGFTEQLKDMKFNDCIQLCKTDQTDQCYWSCENHYGNNSESCSQQLAYSDMSFNKCWDKLTWAIDELNNK